MSVHVRAGLRIYIETHMSITHSIRQCILEEEVSRDANADSTCSSRAVPGLAEVSALLFDPIEDSALTEACDIPLPRLLSLTAPKIIAIISGKQVHTHAVHTYREVQQAQRIRREGISCRRPLAR